MNGMAYGLFATLIVGTILATIGGFFKDSSYIGKLIITVAKFLQNMTGVGIGLGIAWSMKLDGLKLIAITAVGGIASYLNLNIYNPSINEFANLGLRIGDPLTIYLVVIGTLLVSNLILKKKTPVDIVIIPFTIVLIGMVFTLLLNYPISFVTKSIGYIVGVATEAQPFIMGIVISVVMGMALTAPISSAAIAAMILTVTETTQNPEAIAIAGGAALVGCSVQMVGFAIQSIRDNKIGTVISVGIGTSMLQFKNILKKPIIWLPTIIVSAVLGPISTCVLKLQCTGSSAGMGTSGLVGQIGMYSQMGSTWQTWVGIFGLHIILPAVLVFVIDAIFRKYNLIKKGDLTI
jgi:uncharacterized membrane protein